MLLFRTSLFIVITFVSNAICHADPIVLLTGGTGYIGSHVSVELMQNGYDVVIVDNLVNSDASVVKGIEEVAGRQIIAFYNADLRNKSALQAIFASHKIEAVIHLAALKALKESIDKPIPYYDNNLGSTIALLEVMKEHDCNRLVFSSSATVYGKPQYLPIDEKHPTAPTNPYGWSKLMIEQMLEDTAKANAANQFISLRYFNPVGAHKSTIIGEHPKGTPQNLVPYILQVVQGKQPSLKVFGNSYNTPDGTGVRDYIHIMDLAEGHVYALNYLFSGKGFGHSVYNLGTGIGYSVKEMVDALSKKWGQELPCEYAKERPGDVAEVYADASKAKADFGFEAKRSLDEMMEDSLKWALRDMPNSASQCPQDPNKAHH